MRIMTAFVGGTRGFAESHSSKNCINFYLFAHPKSLINRKEKL